MTALLALLMLVAGAADTACAESGRDYHDGAVVLQVVRNRARSGWARYDGTLSGALWSPRQHAHGCRWPITVEHVELGVLFVLNALPVEPWARDALWYCGDYDRPGLCEGRHGGHVELAGVVRHRFYAPDEDGS